MFIKNPNNISKNLIKEIIYKYNKGYSIDEICNYTTQRKDVVIHVLLTFGIPERSFEQDCYTSFLDDEELIIISDTHFGSELENYDLINYVYDYAHNHGINNIIHGGDFIQGTKEPVKKDSIDLLKQVEKVNNHYPNDQSITNHILIGNHDLHSLTKQGKILKILQKREDFHILNPRISYIKWQDQAICLSHHATKYTLTIPNLSYLINFAGHHHCFRLKREDKIYLPTLSNDIKGEDDNFKPGFLVANKNDETISIKRVSFDLEHDSVYEENVIKKLTK